MHRFPKGLSKAMTKKSVYDVLTTATGEENKHDKSMEELLEVAKQNSVFDVLVSAVAENKVIKDCNNSTDSIVFYRRKALIFHMILKVRNPCMIYC